MQTKAICNVVVLWWHSFHLDITRLTSCQPKPANHLYFFFFLLLCSPIHLSFSIFVGRRCVYSLMCVAFIVFIHVYLFSFNCWSDSAGRKKFIIMSSFFFVVVDVVMEKVQKSTVSSQNTRISDYLFIDFGSQHISHQIKPIVYSAIGRPYVRNGFEIWFHIFQSLQLVSVKPLFWKPSKWFIIEIHNANEFMRSSSLLLGDFTMLFAFEIRSSD